MRKEYVRKKKAAVKIQSTMRMHLTRKQDPESRLAVGLLRLKARRRARAATVIQRWWRFFKKVDEVSVRDSMSIIVQEHEYCLFLCCVFFQCQTYSKNCLSKISHVSGEGVVGH